MKYRKLGKTDTKVSIIGLGTMTWGHQNSQAEAFEQMDFALENGVNFFDTAELYPVPGKAETYAETEKIIGRWLKKSGKRDKIVLATKIVGPNPGFRYMRDGEIPRLNRANIMQAVEKSLERLETDYIDLYQVHWPDRNTNFFGKQGYSHNKDEHFTPIEETLNALDELLKAGKVRHIGLSNETPWGLSKYLELSKYQNLSRVVTVQNPYSLVNRTYEVGMAEISMREQVGLLAYSPLAFGRLSGKYYGGAKPENARLNMPLFKPLQRYNNPETLKAADAYTDLAKEHGLEPAQMALAFINSRPFLTSTIIGATNLKQLKMNIDSVNVILSDEVLAGIEAIHKSQPNPAP